MRDVLGAVIAVSLLIGGIFVTGLLVGLIWSFFKAGFMITSGAIGLA